MIEIKRIQQQPDVAQAIYEVMTDVYPVSPWTLEQIQADLSQDQTWYVLAYDGEEVIGFLAIQENIFEVEVLQIAVKKSYQGQGIASALFAALPTDKEIFLGFNTFEVVWYKVVQGVCFLVPCPKSKISCIWQGFLVASLW